MPIVIGKSVNFLPTKFTPKAGQIYSQGVNLPPVKNPCVNVIFGHCAYNGNKQITRSMMIKLVGKHEALKILTL